MMIYKSENHLWEALSRRKSEIECDIAVSPDMRYGG